MPTRPRHQAPKWGERSRVVNSIWFSFVTNSANVFSSFTWCGISRRQNKPPPISGCAWSAASCHRAVWRSPITEETTPSRRGNSAVNPRPPVVQTHLRDKNLRTSSMSSADHADSSSFPPSPANVRRTAPSRESVAPTAAETINPTCRSKRFSASS